MTIANMSDPGTLNGATVHGSDGAKLGKVDAVYYDNDTEQPEWVAVKSGLFGSHVSLVPLQRGEWDGEVLTVPFDKTALEASPHHDPDTELSPSDEDELYTHYGMSSRHTTVDDDRRDRSGERGVEGRDRHGGVQVVGRDGVDDVDARIAYQCVVVAVHRDAG